MQARTAGRFQEEFFFKVSCTVRLLCRVFGKKKEYEFNKHYAPSFPNGAPHTKPELFYCGTKSGEWSRCTLRWGKQHRSGVCLFGGTSIRVHS